MSFDADKIGMHAYGYVPLRKRKIIMENSNEKDCGCGCNGEGKTCRRNKIVIGIAITLVIGAVAMYLINRQQSASV